MANSSRLGGAYERDIAKRLSAWFGLPDGELACWRVPGSGAVATLNKRKGASGDVLSGDLQALKPEFMPFFDLFYIDCKNYSYFNPVLINPKNQKSNSILQQWFKTVTDAGKKKPIMVVNIRDRITPELIFVNTSFTCNKESEIRYYMRGLTEPLSVMLLSEFLELNKWDDLVKLNQG